MGSLKELITGNLIHSRSIDMKSYALDEDTVLVEGWLRDDRFEKIYNTTGEEMDKGPVHYLTIRLKVGGSPPAILDAEAEMPHVPLEFCRTVLDSIPKVIGMNIQAGFVKKVRALMGGVKGCSHLTHLLTVMSQAALHGYITNKWRKKRPVANSIDDVENIEFLVGSCRAWTQDGPKLEALKAAIARR
ncbi:MAG: DUF2889 domain-containing protein [Desulfobacterales bacterium]|jgi:hypothetical protein|nr:DUF2889 domain-containing protein [Desulfobacterales bacterium]